MGPEIKFLPTHGSGKKGQSVTNATVKNHIFHIFKGHLDMENGYCCIIERSKEERFEF